MNIASLIGWSRSPATANHKIFRAAATVGTLTVGVKLIALSKEIAVANYFGRSDAVDAFLAAYLVPGFVIALVAGSLSAALIPTFIQVRQRDGEGAAQRLFSSCMVWSQSLLLGLSVLLAGTAPYLFRALARGFSADKLQLCTHLLYAMLPLILLSGLAANFTAIFYANKCFWIPAISPMLTPLLTCVLLLTRARIWGAWSLAAGAVLGGLCECVLLGTALRRKGTYIWPRWHGLTPDVRQVGLQYLPLLFGALLTSGVTVVDQSMAAWLQPGSMAALAYGNRIVSVVVGLTATSLSAAVIPYFSEMVVARNWGACRDTLKTYTRILLPVMTAICALLIALSPVLVRQLFQRGAFSAQDTMTVSRVQVMYALQIPFYAAGVLYVRLLTAMNRNDLVMISAGINLGLDVVLNLVCMKWFGVAGIALSTSLFYVGSLAFAVLMARRLLRVADSIHLLSNNSALTDHSTSPHVSESTGR
jgi:putative peptidoglycan lipid II flippase